jgi:hypothetical protein
MSFKGKQHSEKTKKKISDSRKKYRGEKHPRFGANWTDEQRAKYILTTFQRREEEKRIKMFLVKYDNLYKNFQLENNKK